MAHPVELLAYVAGIIDGEGCIGVYSASGHKSHYLHVKVAMRDPAIVALLIDKFGAKPNHYRNKTGKVYRAVFGGRAANEFLKQIRPYLILKKEQADLALEFFRVRTSYKGFSVPADELALRNDLELRLKALKRPQPEVLVGYR